MQASQDGRMPAKHSITSKSRSDQLAFFVGEYGGNQLGEGSYATNVCDIPERPKDVGGGCGRAALLNRVHVIKDVYRDDAISFRRARSEEAARVRPSVDRRRPSVDDRGGTCPLGRSRLISVPALASAVCQPAVLSDHLARGFSAG